MQPANGEQPACRHVRRPAHAKADAAHADSGRGDRRGGVCGSTADADGAHRRAAVRTARVVCLDGRLSPSGLANHASAGGHRRAITRDRRLLVAAPLATTRHGTAACHHVPRRAPLIPATARTGRDVRLSQPAHDARDLDRARAATGTDRFERPPVEVSYRAVIDAGRQGQDGNEGPRGSQQPPDSRHRHALSARSAASRLRDGIAASSAASARPYPLAPTHSPQPVGRPNRFRRLLAANRADAA